MLLPMRQEPTKAAPNPQRPSQSKKAQQIRRLGEYRRSGGWNPRSGADFWIHKLFGYTWGPKDMLDREGRYPCYHCQERVLPGAKKCPYCGENPEWPGLLPKLFSVVAYTMAFVGGLVLVLFLFYLLLAFVGCIGAIGLSVLEAGGGAG